MKLTITKIDSVLWQGDAISVTVPGAGGEMTVLAHHAPLISTLREGSIIVRTEGKEESIPVQGGFIEVGKNETTILV